MPVVRRTLCFTLSIILTLSELKTTVNAYHQQLIQNFIPFSIRYPQLF